MASRFYPWFGGLLVSIMVGASAQSTPPATGVTAADADPVLDTVEVLADGMQFGPGMWRVHRDGRSLWILGTQSPLPRRMQWHAEPVLERLAQSQALLLPPTVKSDIGMVRGALLLPSALRARRNPGDVSLREVLPEPLYARWQVLKQRYLPRDRKVERFRPLFAAQELYVAGIESAGLDLRPAAERTVRKAAGKLDLVVIRPQLPLELDSPRRLIREFAGEHLDDLECFERTLTRLETDLDAMRQRANAWAVGDVLALWELPAPNHLGACAEAMRSAQALADTGLVGLPERMRELWLNSAKTALATHESTFAYLPMSRLLGEDGLLAALRAAGFEIDEPE